MALDRHAPNPIIMLIEATDMAAVRRGSLNTRSALISSTSGDEPVSLVSMRARVAGLATWRASWLGGRNLAAFAVEAAAVAAV